MFDIIPVLRDHSIEYQVVSGTDERIIVCPSCGRNDHFYYNIKKNLGICHRCKWECNAVALIMAVLNLGRDAALNVVGGHRDSSPDGLRGKVKGLLDEIRESSENIDSHEVFFRNPLPQGLEDIAKKKFPRAFAERKVSSELILWTGAKICNSKGKYFNRIIFPVKTLKSETFTAVTALSKKGFREAKELAEERGRKYRKSLFPEGSFISEVLYMYNETKKSSNPLFIVEGVWDVLKLKKYGFNTVGLLGSSVSRRQAYLLSETEADSVFLMLDGSVPLKSLKKYHGLLSEMCVDKEIRVCFLPEGKDPDDSTREEIEKAIGNSRKYLF